MSKFYTKNLLFLMTCSLFAFSFSIGDYFSNEKFTYLDTTKGKTTNLNYIVKKDKGKIIITKSSDDEVNNFEYSEKYILQKTTSQILGSNDLETMIIDNGTIKADAVIKNKKISKEYKIDQPWIQEFTFGLRPFLSDSAQEQKFYILNPDNLDLHELVAIKKGIVNITIKDQTFKAQKLIITVPGFKVSFWSAKAFYDLETANLLKYEANKGPGTPTTVTTIEVKN